MRWVGEREGRRVEGGRPSPLHLHTEWRIALTGSRPACLVVPSLRMEKRGEGVEREKVFLLRKTAEGECCSHVSTAGLVLDALPRQQRHSIL